VTLNGALHSNSVFRLSHIYPCYKHGRKVNVLETGNEISDTYLQPNFADVSYLSEQYSALLKEFKVLEGSVTRLKSR
jgi:hypothetical protein